jgi:hypothetical protein
MKDILNRIKGSKVRVKKGNDAFTGLLCKSLLSSVGVNEWFLLTVGVRFSESDIAQIKEDPYSLPVIILKELKNIPEMDK